MISSPFVRSGASDKLNIMKIQQSIKNKLNH
jgi:hypothetical protein